MTDAPDELEGMVRAHWREVYALLVMLTRNPTLAEDLAQEVFLVAWRKTRPAGPGLRLWLRAVARRLALNELRRKRPEPMAPADLQRLAESASALEDFRPGPPFEEELAALRTCLEGLPADDCNLLRAHYEGGEPLARLAETARQSVGYVKQRLFRLRRRLEECIRRRLAQAEKLESHAGQTAAISHRPLNFRLPELSPARNP